MGTVLYYIFRPNELVLFLLVLIIASLLTLIPKIHIGKNIKIAIIVIFCILFLIYSFFNSRIYSYDGLNYYLKTVLLISKKGYLTTTEYPLKPYLGELISAGIYKYAGLRILNLFFGIISLLNVFLMYSLLKKLTQNKSEINLSFLLLLSSPTFIAFTTTEFKPDLLASVLFLFSLLLFYKFTNGRLTLFPIISFILSCSIFIKASVLLPALTLILAGFILLCKSKGSIRKRVFIGVLTLFLSLAPPLLWIRTFGFSIPQFESIAHINPILKQYNQKVVLTRDKEILTSCTLEKVRKDYTSFIYGSVSPLVIFQPIFYLTKFHSYAFSSQLMANPGIFLYFGIIVFLSSILFYKKIRQNLNDFTKSLYWSGIISTIVFMITISSVFWYLLPLFPIFALSISKIIYRIPNNKIQRITLMFCYTVITTNILIGIYMATDNFYPLKNFSQKEIAKTDIKTLYDVNNQINLLPKDQLILDASEHFNNFLATFVEDADSRIVKSNYYFASNTKLLEELREELLKNNIHFIIIDKNKILDPWYRNCPLENNKRLLLFLNRFTEPVYPENIKYRDLIFKILWS